MYILRYQVFIFGIMTEVSFQNIPLSLPHWNYFATFYLDSVFTWGKDKMADVERFLQNHPHLELIKDKGNRDKVICSNGIGC